MINLQKISGLPIELADDFRLKFDPPLSDREPTWIRDPAEVVAVLVNPNIPVRTTYLGYRQLYLPKDQEIIDREHLQYDITILPPVMLGQEYNKTVGHYHANIPGLQIAHPELYQVLHGHGLFILQKMDEAFQKLLDVIVVLAKAGDKIIYPPNYGHNFVNTGPEPLVTANWLSTDYKPLYEPVAKRRGLAYYVVRGQSGQPEFVPNKNYDSVKEIRQLNTKAYSKFAAMRPGTMYRLAMNEPQVLEFLNHPEKYFNELSALVS